jgi:phosphoribosylaminoimidazolecarboxamide formyltransferase / IMP cyclohydrolase
MGAFMQRTALFSLDDTTNVVEYARSLIDLGWKIIATAETFSILIEHGISCEEITAYTGVTTNYGIPPTLHPKIENALTLDNPGNRIDMVYDIPYPLNKGNDVGGRTLLALAAKGRRIPVASPSDLEIVIRALQAADWVSEELLQSLIDKVYAEIAGHYLDLAKKSPTSPFGGQIGKVAFPLLNGENPYQTAQIFDLGGEDPLALPRFRQLSSTPPCFTNLADTDALLKCLCLTDATFQAHYQKQPFLSAASKHGNVCGLAVDWESPLKSVERALFGNPLAVWGGELMTNFPIDDLLADLLLGHVQREKMLGSASWMLDVVAAPDFSSKAAEKLLKRKARKVLQNPALANPQAELSGYSYRPVRGGFIRQAPPWRLLQFNELEGLSQPLNSEETDDLILAWAAAFTSFHGGNEVALSKKRSLIGVGGGPSTVQAAEVAVMRARQAQHEIKGGVFCADAFFPFTDAADILIDAGVSMGCVPAGGKNDTLVRQNFSHHGVRVFYLPEDFRGFCRH